MASDAASRIDELRARVQKDPGSIAFAQLAEEYRRAGLFHEAIEACQAGLSRHPGYLSARVTLGRALIEVGDLVGAQQELSAVIRLAPENLSAIRGLAEVHRRRGDLPEAVEEFRPAPELPGTAPAAPERAGKEAQAALQPAARDRARAAVSPPRVAAAPQPVAAADTPESIRARRTTAYLERWLEAIVADRRTRLYGSDA